jgi:hypothetical protein
MCVSRVSMILSVDIFPRITLVFRCFISDEKLKIWNIRKEQLNTLGQIIKQIQRLQSNLNITKVLDIIQNYMRKLIQNVNRMPRNRLPRLMKNHTPEGRGNQDHWRDFWMCETGTGQQVGQLLDCYIVMMMTMMMMINVVNQTPTIYSNHQHEILNLRHSMLWRAFIV